MEQMKLLWEYQNLDILVDQCEDQRKNSSLRQRLVELKNYLTEQQADLVKLEGETDKKSGLLRQINHEYEISENEFKAQCQQLDENQIKTLEQLEKMRDDAITLKEKITRKSLELTKLLAEINSIERKLETMRTNVTKAKKEYTDVKLLYDKELAEIQSEYSKVKKDRDAVGSKIDNVLLAKYVKIKDRRSTAVSTIENDRCSGCNMMLASVVVQSIKDKNEMIECENCGRLLYFTEKK